MKVEDAAKLINMNPQTLRLALQDGLLPFGIAVKTSPNRYTYVIFPQRLDKYLKGDDLYATNCNCCNSNHYDNVECCYSNES